MLQNQSDFQFFIYHLYTPSEPLIRYLLDLLVFSCCMLRDCSSAYHCLQWAVICVTCSQLWAVLALLHGPLSLTRVFFACRTAAHWMFFSFFAAFPAKLCCAWKSNLRYSRPPCPGTKKSFHGQSHFDHISSPFWHLVWKNSSTSWTCLHSFMHLVAATWFTDDIFAVRSWWTGLPNKVLSECSCIFTETQANHLGQLKKTGEAMSQSHFPYLYASPSPEIKQAI